MQVAECFRGPERSPLTGSHRLFPGLRRDPREKKGTLRAPESPHVASSGEPLCCGDGMATHVLPGGSILPASGSRLECPGKGPGPPLGKPSAPGARPAALLSSSPASVRRLCSQCGWRTAHLGPSSQAPGNPVGSSLFTKNTPPQGDSDSIRSVIPSGPGRSGRCSPNPHFIGRDTAHRDGQPTQQ